MSDPRLSFYLNNLEILAIKEKMKEHGLDFDKDFDKYVQRTLSYQIEKEEFKNCDTHYCKVKRTNFKSPITKKKTDFLQCVANKNSTTISSAISVLLLKGYPIKP